MRNMAIEKIDFELASPDGEKFSLSEKLRENPVLLVFIRHDCPTCQFIMPFIERLHSRYGGRKGVFRIIAQDEEPQIREFVKDNGVSITVLMDKSPHEVSRKFDFDVVPTVILLNRDGRELQRSSGFQKEKLEKMNSMLAGQGLSPEPLFGLNEEIPALRPG
jgi:thiol-disulfide isomerase/thioredoxin